MMTEYQAQAFMALREQMVAAVMLIDQLIDAPEEIQAPHEVEAGCAHPQDMRKDASTMGHPRYQCQACNTIVEEQEP